MRYTRTATIAAPPADVWAVLIDLERWPDWTASMREITRLDAGALRVGSTARVRQPTGKPRIWTVTELAADRSFTWTSTAPGLHLAGYHELTPTERGVRAELTFALTGPLAWLGALLAGRRMRRDVGLEADGLTRAAERRAQERAVDE